MKDLNTGVLFKNKNKTEADKLPDLIGHFTCNDGKYSLVGWYQNYLSKQCGETFRGSMFRTDTGFTGYINMPSGRLQVSCGERSATDGNKIYPIRLSFVTDEIQENENCVSLACRKFVEK